MDPTLQTKFKQLPEITTGINVLDMFNPSKLHIRYNYINNMPQILSMEAEMRSIFKPKNAPQVYHPQKNEMVAVYYPLDRKYFRAVVEEVGTYPDLNSSVWILDHGASNDIRNPLVFRKLPKKFETVRSPIAEMCIAVQPIKTEDGITKPVSFREWNKEALIKFYQVIQTAKQLKIDEFECRNGIIFGDIYAKFKNGVIFSIKKCLIDNNYAVELDYSSDFVNELYNSSPNRRRFSFRYEDNLTELGSGDDSKVAAVLEKTKFQK